MIVACVAVKSEPELDAFLAHLVPYVDDIVVADESVGPIYGGGIGPSLRWAWRQALERGATQVVQIDAGGSHDPRAIRELVDHPADVVIGSRFRAGSTYTGRPWRRSCSQAYAFWQNVRTEGTRSATPKISDWTSGYRCFSRDALEHLASLQYRARMHGWQAEVLLRAIDAGYSIGEVPISYQAGDSSFTWKHAREALAVR